jgi:hypothetical protein
VGFTHVDNEAGATSAVPELKPLTAIAKLTALQ